MNSQDEKDNNGEIIMPIVTGRIKPGRGTVMKKRVILLICMLLTLLCCCALADVKINEDNFPDENFRWFMWEHFGNELSDDEIDNTTEIKIYGWEYKCESLQGIEFFTSLKKLECSDNWLTSLDVSNNTRLEHLQCSSNDIAELDVSRNTKLKELHCYDNELTSLDISRSTKLKVLDCGYNKLTSLNVSKNTSLERLYCSNNRLSFLDVSKNTNLEYLYCEENNLASLKVGSANPSFIECYQNNLTTLDVSNCKKLKSVVINKTRVRMSVDDFPVDVFGNSSADDNWLEVDPKVTVIAGEFTSLPTDKDISIDSKSFPDAEFCAYVERYDLDENNVLSSKEIQAAREMDVSDYQITSMKGIEKFTALVKLDCSGNNLKTLDVSKNTKLEELVCSDNRLTALDISHNSRLDTLLCDHNKLSALDVSINTRLEEMWCSNNSLTSLDVSRNNRLQDLACNKNKLTSLDVSRNKKLQHLDCRNNNLTKLSVSKNVKLKDLHCEGNSFTKLDVTKCPVLKAAVEKTKRKSSDDYDYWKNGDDKILSTDRIVTVVAGNTVSQPVIKNLKATIGGLNYKLDFSKGTAVFTGPKDKNTISVKIPETVKYLGKKFMVTEIAAKSCRWMGKLETVSIGKNVTKIGSYAFDGCAKLKKITIKTKLLTAKNVGNYAFAIDYKKPTVKCPKDKLAEYKKFLPKKGMPKKAKYTK